MLVIVKMTANCFRIHKCDQKLFREKNSYVSHVLILGMTQNSNLTAEKNNLTSHQYCIARKNKHIPLKKIKKILKSLHTGIRRLTPTGYMRHRHKLCEHTVLVTLGIGEITQSKVVFVLHLYKYR